MATATGTDLSTLQVLLDNVADDTVRELVAAKGYEKEALEYLDSICSSEAFDLTRPDSITMELGELEHEENAMKANIQKKTIANIDVILSAHETLNSTVAKFSQEFNGEADRLHGDFQAAQDWESVVRAVREHGVEQQAHVAESAVILQNIDSIMDILELPALTAACVKQGHYSESLEISSHSKRLSIRYSDIQIVNKIESDIKAEIGKMLAGLIRLLRTDLKQSSILKIMTYLKRINPFSGTHNDKELKLIYLQARYHYVVSELEVLTPIRSSNVEKFLKRNIEVIREHCFSTIVTFENIFNSEDPALLREFVLSIVMQLVEVLRENLPAISDHSAKENLLLQLCYCSNSLNRIGFEFSAVLLSELGADGIITVQEWITVTARRKKLTI